MSGSSPSMLDQQRRMKAGLRARMKRTAAARTCEKCGRGYAVKRYQLDPWTSVRVCRWCGELPPKQTSALTEPAQGRRLEER